MNRVWNALFLTDRKRNRASSALIEIEIGMIWWLEHENTAIVIQSKPIILSIYSTHQIGLSSSRPRNENSFSYDWNSQGDRSSNGRLFSGLAMDDEISLRYSFRWSLMVCIWSRMNEMNKAKATFPCWLTVFRSLVIPADVVTVCCSIGRPVSCLGRRQTDG